MHEMGIIIHLSKTLDKVAEENRLKKIGSVTLQIGEVSGIVTDLFQDAWDYFTKKHPVLNGSKLIIEPIEAVTHCDGCGKNYETVKHGRICPHCGSKETWLIKGNECIIKEIEAESIDDPDGREEDA
jgi:hydrogenase nickel incorporation protein HypA/HybF